MTYFSHVRPCTNGANHDVFADAANTTALKVVLHGTSGSSPAARQRRSGPLREDDPTLGCAVLRPRRVPDDLQPGRIPVGVGYDCVMEGLSAVRWALDELPPDTPIVVVSAYGPERSLPGIAAIGAGTTRPPR